MLAAFNDYARWSDPSLKIPHMGWNTLKLAREHALFEGIPTGDAGLNAYFVHSYDLVRRAPIQRQLFLCQGGWSFWYAFAHANALLQRTQTILTRYSGSAGMAFSGGGSHGLIPDWRSHAFDPLDLEIIALVDEVAWEQVSARQPSSDTTQDEERRASLRKRVFALAGNGGVDLRHSSRQSACEPTAAA